MSASSGTPPVVDGRADPGPPWIVAVGASAGGLEALQEFLGAIEAPVHAAIVVAQHLAPDHSSLIVELLSRATRLSIVEAEDGAQLVTGTVFVAPPNRDVTIAGDRLRVIEPGAHFSPSPNIDLLFESLAEGANTGAVAVVLSGTGSDGARGLRAVKAIGGLTMVQTPEEAGFDGMPRAALGLGGADVVDSAAQLGRRVHDVAGGTELVRDLDLPANVPDSFTAVVAVLQRSVGVDFSRYKQATVQRQIKRRMAMRQVTDLDAYVALLANEIDEAHALMGNILVTVTSFFRDENAFDALRQRLVAYLNRPGSGETLRIWVAGCATGEEAYSIAMLAGEAMGFPVDLRRRLKIFGSDLDETSLSIARRAAYAASAGLAIPGHLRAHYVKEDASGIQMTEELRECVVFARHDLGYDPPFPQIDVVSCRNTLIFFTPSLQRQVLESFAYALRPGGLLFLGNAESMESGVAGFRVLDAESRIFTRTNERARGAARSFPRELTTSTGTSVLARRAGATVTAEVANQVAMLEALLRLTGQAFMVLDADHKLLQVVGDVTPYCRIPEGQVTSTVGSLLRPELQDEARALFLLSRGAAQPMTGKFIHLDHGEIVRLEVRPLQVSGARLVVLAFHAESALPVEASVAPPRGEEFDRELRRLEQELLASQDVQSRALSELQAANEELEATSEELQSSNEELQAANEELQATNEQLGTMNQELRQTSEEAQRVNTDLTNIQSSLSQGMVIVDQDLRVIRFSPLAVRVFALVASDVGRPLLSVPTTMSVAGLEDALVSVVAGSPRVNLQASGASASFLVQVLPYLSLDGRIQGAIVTLTDITEMTVLRLEAEEVAVELQTKSELLERQAAIDAGTGLANRSFFTDALRREIARADRSGTRLALAWIDVDRFKEVNDEYGHEAGDVTLRETGTRLLRAVRGTDVVGRLGGDEFGVMVTGYEGAGELEAVLERLVLAMREPVQLDGGEARVTGSIGVAVYPDDETTVEGLLRSSDAAMYSIKGTGGDAYAYFDASMNVEADFRRSRRVEIESAIERREFELHYQPIVDAGSGAFYGAEALLRWRHDGELVEAKDFIPFCEDSGQIRHLGLLTLGLLRADFEAMEAAGSVPVIAVNMSVTQLEDPALAGLIDQWPNPHGLSGIVVEIVESVFLPGHQVALEVVQSLVRLGAAISIDDYGSGYSNFRLLESVSPAYIKLDRSFLFTGHGESGRAALIASAVEMSHVMEAKVIAEGVENTAQRDLAVGAGADYLQGFGIARPMPLAELLAWIADPPPCPWDA